MSAALLAIEPGTDRAAIDRRCVLLAIRDECRELRRLLVAKRKDAGLSLAQLAGQMGVAEQAVAEWESGTKHPSLPAFLLWARALDREVVVR